MQCCTGRSRDQVLTLGFKGAELREGGDQLGGDIGRGQHPELGEFGLEPCPDRVVVDHGRLDAGVVTDAGGWG